MAEQKPLRRDVVWSEACVTREQREQLLGQRGCAVWLTGLSGAGKSSIAHATSERLHAAGRLNYVLDGDNLRHGLNADLGFSPEHRRENIRRAGEVAALFVDAGAIVIIALISPLRVDREMAQRIVGAERFVEVFVDAPLEICERRDPKGLFAKARRGEIAEFTGISAPYEPPSAPALTLLTAQCPLRDCVDRLVAHLSARGFLTALPPISPTNISTLNE